MKLRFAVVLFVLCPLMSMGQEIINMGNKREIFVDSYLIDKLDGVKLQMNTPRDEGPVLFFDKPWEGGFCNYVTVMKIGDAYHVYYLGKDCGTRDTEGEVTGYAQSNDGIHWVKPNLKLYEVNGTFDNNVVLADAGPSNHNFCPFLDTNPNATPDQRFKALAYGGGGLKAFISPDGIHWKALQEDGVIKKGQFDSQNVSFWSETEQCYVCYFRTWTRIGEKWGFRTVSRTTSADFINWTDPVAMTFGDTPMEHLYVNQTSPYFRAPHIYVATAARFMQGRQIITEEQGKAMNVDRDHYYDCSDAVLMTSRGGNKYDRTFMESFIRPGIGLNNWVSRTNYPALNVVQTGPAEMSLYVVQDYAQPSCHLRRYSLRLDGFTSILAQYAGGEVLTKLFTFNGNELEINYSTSAAGEIRIEIQDANGKPFPGFTLEDSQTIIGNEIERIVSWKNGANLKELTGKPVRLRIVMKDADLFSIRFK